MADGKVNLARILGVRSKKREQTLAVAHMGMSANYATLFCFLPLCLAVLLVSLALLLWALYVIVFRLSLLEDNTEDENGTQWDWEDLGAFLLAVFQIILALSGFACSLLPAKHSQHCANLSSETTKTTKAQCADQPHGEPQGKIETRISVRFDRGATPAAVKGLRKWKGRQRAGARAQYTPRVRRKLKLLSLFKTLASAYILAVAISLVTNVFTWSMLGIGSQWRPSPDERRDLVEELARNVGILAFYFAFLHGVMKSLRLVLVVGGSGYERLAWFQVLSRKTRRQTWNPQKNDKNDKNDRHENPEEDRLKTKLTLKLT